MTRVVQQKSDDARGEYLVACPLTKFYYWECEKYRHRKTTCLDLCHVQKDYATETSPEVRIKKRKMLYESSTTLCSNSKWREPCTNVRARAQGFAWHFWHEKSEVRIRKNAGVLLKKQYIF